MDIQYFAWLSSKGENDKMRNGAKWAGMVIDLPDEFKGLKDESEERRYCAIYEPPTTAEIPGFEGTRKALQDLGT